MINLKFIQLLIGLITILIAYVLVITPVGCFRAWVAKQCGDHTAEDMGFLTLNPLMHMDPLGVLFLTLFGVGWGRHIPINPHHIDGKHRRLKIGCAYFSDTFAHIILATTTLILFIALFGSHSLALYSSTVSSFGISIARIIVAFIQLNVFLAVIALVINAIDC